MQLTKDDITLIKDYFSNQPVIKAYLFGSYSRSESTEESDVDILVELDYSQRIGLNFFGMKNELEKKLNKSVDLITANSLSKYIKPFVEKDKTLIYERGNGPRLFNTI